MTHEEWLALGLAEQWRAVVNTPLFKQACSVILEELYQFRTVGTVEQNGLQNQFKEGTYSAISTLKALANPARPKPKMPEAWIGQEAKAEAEKKLPPGPVRKEIIRE